ncbi:hypothetical protein AAMO2058_000561800 [Amorphochlora amoebiformis]|mmetsp:Transcript_18441/g.29400  ORF Transcript_18441/g.29400 Transcript_18441/m.29400 type:complete len:407 (-) Transcript_18441:94-1314(-)
MADMSSSDSETEVVPRMVPIGRMNTINPAQAVLTLEDDGTFITSIGLKEHRDTRFHKHAQVVSNIESKLRKTKRNYKQRMDKLMVKEKAYLKSQQTTTEAIEKFKTYIFDSDKKRKRIEKRLQEKRKIGKEKDHKILQLQERLKQIRVRNTRLEQSIKNVSSYMKYLEDVVRDPSHPTSNKDDLIARLELLDSTYESLSEKVKSVDREKIRTSKKMNELDKGKQNQLLLRKGAIAKLREKIDKAASMSSHSNEERRQRDAKTKEMLVRVSEVRYSIYNLHYIIQHSYPVSKSLEPFEPTAASLENKTLRECTDSYFENCKKQLNKIRDRVSELREIVPKSMLEKPDSLYEKKPPSDLVEKAGCGRQRLRCKARNAFSRRASTLPRISMISRSGLSSVTSNTLTSTN